MTRTKATSSKIEKPEGTIAIVTIVSSLAKVTRSSSTVGASKTCSNRRSGENECHNGKYAIATSSVCTKAWSICHEDELREKLL